MPKYDFACVTCDFQIEKHFNFNEEHRVECEMCECAMVKVIKAIPTHFKGGGWGASN
jgi:putative FmdB family regulatory protein